MGSNTLRAQAMPWELSLLSVQWVRWCDLRMREFSCDFFTRTLEAEPTGFGGSPLPTGLCLVNTQFAPSALPPSQAVECSLTIFPC